MSGQDILIEQLRADVERLTAERDAAFEQGRIVGRADVAKYARAIGEIESVVGIVGAVPMPQTAQAVRDLVSRAEKAERERDKARANYAFMVERAADQKLDGYRELGARAAAAEERAEKAERERDARPDISAEDARAFMMFKPVPARDSREGPVMHALRAHAAKAVNP